MNNIEIDNIVDNLLVLDKDTKNKALADIFDTYDYVTYSTIVRRLADKLRINCV